MEQTQAKMMFRISNNGITYSFTTPEELQLFVKKNKISSAAFSITNFEALSETCTKETERLNLKAEF